MKKSLLSGILTFIALFLFASFSHGQQDGKYLSFKNGYQQTDNNNTLPARETQDGNEAYYQIGFSFSSALHTTVNVENADYDVLHIDGFALMGQVGAPALPAHNEIIAMPRGANGKIVILNTEYFEYDGFMIHPALEPAFDTEGAPEPEFWIDESVYSKNDFFPKHLIEVTDILLSRGNPLAMTQIRPVQFNPVTGVIRVYTNIEFKVEYEGAVASFDEIANGNSLHYTNLLKRTVLNSDNIPDGISASESKVAEKNYIIITHDTSCNHI